MSNQKTSSHCLRANPTVENIIAEIGKHERRIRAQWGQIGSDALDNALWHLSRGVIRGDYDPSKGTLSQWCRTVLYRYLYSTGRKARRQQRWERLSSTIHEDHVALTPFLDAESSEDVFLEVNKRELADFDAQPFSTMDQARVESWPLFDRVFVLSMSGLWRKVSCECWSEWTLVLESKRPLLLPAPPMELYTCESPQQRTPIVASTFKMTRNNVSQRWHRKRALLEQLDCIKSLQAAV